MNEEREIRTVPVNIEVRNNAKNEPVLVGMAAVYNSRSSNLGGFTEIIEPGFFSGCLDNDVIATIEHNNERLVGRTKSGTLKIADTAEGLQTENIIPPTTDGNDLLTLIKRKDISGMSFAFRCKSGMDEWKTDEATGATTRTLKSGGCERLYDVTYTSNPAYQDTQVAQRSLEKSKEQSDAEKQEAERKLSESADDDLAIEHDKLKRRIKLAQL